MKPTALVACSILAVAGCSESPGPQNQGFTSNSTSAASTGAPSGSVGGPPATTATAEPPSTAQSTSSSTTTSTTGDSGAAFGTDGTGGSTGGGTTGGAAQTTGGGMGGATTGGATDSGMGGSGGGAVIDPELEAELLEGVGDIEKPPPYEYGPYAERRDVPHGTVQEFTFDEDEFYPDSPARGIKVYEPAQYVEGEEVFLSVFFDGTASWAYLSNNNDGGTYRTLNVFDNLIDEGLIPPFIGVFIGNDGDGGERQNELAPVDDKQARFILEAVLPAVSERYGYNFSSDPKKRSITGESSGGNAAFTVAWNRPDAFHRMQGHSSSFSFGPARDFPNIVRDTEEVKPLRIHLEGGMMDGGHHAEMAAALAEKGYVYQWFNSTGSGHGGPGGDRSFPEGLIWLWKGWEHL